MRLSGGRRLIDIYKAASLQRRNFSSGAPPTRLSGPSSDVSSTLGSTPLARVLHSNILYSGPLTVSEYIRQCLTHPTHGYYTGKEESSIFGSGGDFITAPQVTPIFSELLGVWIASYVRSAGGKFRLVEFGPGSGTLQKTLIPALDRLGCKPESLHLVDASTSLRKAQGKALDGLVCKPERVQWYESTDDLFGELEEEDGKTEMRTMFIAHEFFDALPVHLFQRVDNNASRDPNSKTNSTWREVLIDVDPTSTESEASHALRAVLSKGITPATALISSLDLKPSESVVEVSAKGLSIARRMARVLKRPCDGGAALIVDYGSMQRRGMTLRAISQHVQNMPFLTQPGDVDLTADVDFGALQHVVKDQGVQFFGAVTQRQFLLRLGLAQRIRNVAAHIIDSNIKSGNKKKDENSEEEDEVDGKLKQLQIDYNRLVGTTDKDMGLIYKVAAICGRDVESLPGFED